MTRVVLDTNVLVSALLQPLGPSAKVFALALASHLQLCVSADIYAEHEEAISRPRFKRTPEVIAATLLSIRHSGLWVRPTRAVAVCRDADDDVFVACADAASADYLVTGNLRHFPPSFRITEIVPPRLLLERLTLKKPPNPK